MKSNRPQHTEQLNHVATHYEILNVKADATLQEIKRARKNLLMQHYPASLEVHPGNSFPAQDQNLKDKKIADLTDILEAYNVLSNTKKRKHYDEFLATSRKALEKFNKKINADQKENVLEKNRTKWQKLIDRLGIMSEVSNVGIVVEILMKLIPALVTATGSVLSAIVFYSDPLIYFFKSLIAISRAIGEAFGIEFDEIKYGKHPHQLAAHIAKVVLFSLAITFLLGVVTTSPVGGLIAWALALSGLGVVGHFDYAFQAKKATEVYESTAMTHAAAYRELDAIEGLLKAEIEKYNENNKDATQEEREVAHAEIHASYQDRIDAAKEKMHATYFEKQAAYKEKKATVNSHRLFVALLIGLTFLLLASSAMVFAPPLILPILAIVSKVASGYLALIAVGRFTNWLTSGKDSNIDELKASHSSDMLQLMPGEQIEPTEPTRFQRFKGWLFEKGSIMGRFSAWFSQTDDPTVWLEKHDKIMAEQAQAVQESEVTSLASSADIDAELSRRASLSSTSIRSAAAFDQVVPANVVLDMDSPKVFSSSRRSSPAFAFQQAPSEKPAAPVVSSLTPSLDI